MSTSRRLRVALVLLIVVWIPGTPGLGFETRDGGPAYLGVIYPLASGLALLALILSFRWHRSAAWVGLAAGVAAALLGLLDLAGLLQPVRPPAAIVIEDLALVAVGSFVAWSARRPRP